MGTSRADIARWLKEGKAEGATHTIVVCDTFEHSDYPAHVKKDQDVHEVFKAHNGPNMQRVMEVYNHSVDHEKQLAEYRSFNF